MLIDRFRDGEAQVVATTVDAIGTISESLVETSILIGDGLVGDVAAVCALD